MGKLYAFGLSAPAIHDKAIKMYGGVISTKKLRKPNQRHLSKLCQLLRISNGNTIQWSCM